MTESQLDRRQTDRQTGRQADRQRVKKADKQTKRKTEKQTKEIDCAMGSDRQTDK